MRINIRNYEVIAPNSEFLIKNQSFWQKLGRKFFLKIYKIFRKDIDQIRPIHFMILYDSLANN